MVSFVTQYVFIANALYCSCSASEYIHSFKKKKKKQLSYDDMLEEVRSVWRAKYRKLQLEKLNALNVAYIDSVWCGRQCL